MISLTLKILLLWLELTENIMKMIEMSTLLFLEKKFKKNSKVKSFTHPKQRQTQSQTYQSIQ